MSREAVATALDEAAEALARAAHALRGTEQPAAGGATVAPSPSPVPAAPLPKRPPQESAFTECPAHRKPFEDGRYGPYCTGKGEPDGNWYNDKGYCRVTPKSAGAWLKQHPKGAPAPAPQDVDDIPF